MTTWVFYFFFFKSIPKAETICGAISSVWDSSFNFTLQGWPLKRVSPRVSVRALLVWHAWVLRGWQCCVVRSQRSHRFRPYHRSAKLQKPSHITQSPAGLCIQFYSSFFPLRCYVFTWQGASASRGSRCGAWTPGPRGHDLSQRQTLNCGATRASQAEVFFKKVWGQRSSL